MIMPGPGEDSVPLLLDENDSTLEDSSDEALTSNSSDGSSVLELLRKLVESAREEYANLQTSNTHLASVDELINRGREKYQIAKEEAVKLSQSVQEKYKTRLPKIQSLPWLEIIIVLLYVSQDISTEILTQFTYASYKSRVPNSTQKLLPNRFNQFNIFRSSASDRTCEYKTNAYYIWTTLLENRTGYIGDADDDDDKNAVSILEVETERWHINYSVANMLPSVFVTLAVVAYTDLVGRRFGLILASVGFIFGNLITIIGISHSGFTIFFVIGNLVIGTWGGTSLITGCAYAYISDKMSYDQRTFRFSLISSLRLVSYGIAVIITSMFITRSSYVLPLWTLQLVFIAVLLIVIFIIPESLSATPIKHLSPRKLIPLLISSMLPVDLFCRKRLFGYSRLKLFLLLTIEVTDSLVVGARATILTRFLLGPPFCSSEEEVTYATFIVGCLGFVAPFVASRTIVDWIGTADVGTLACVTSATGLLLLGFTKSLSSLYTALVLQIFLPLPSAVARSLMSKQCDPIEQGSLQAAVTSIHTLGSLMSYTIALGVFFETAALFNGLIFEIMGGLYLVCAAIFTAVKLLERREKEMTSRGHYGHEGVPVNEEEEGPVEGLPHDDQGDNSVFN